MSSGIAVLVVETEVGGSSLALGVQTGGSTLAVEVEFSQGLAGPRGEWGVDRAFQLRKLSLPIVDGEVSIDFSEANTYYILLTEDVTSVKYLNLPDPGVSIRVQLYIQQDGVGGRTLSGWPQGTRSMVGLALRLTPNPAAMDSVVLDTFDGGTTMQLNLVGQDYRPL